MGLHEKLFFFFKALMCSGSTISDCISLLSYSILVVQVRDWKSDGAFEDALKEAGLL